MMKPKYSCVEGGETCLHITAITIDNAVLNKEATEWGWILFHGNSLFQHVLNGVMRFTISFTCCDNTLVLILLIHLRNEGGYSVK
jgi:hypothetical protein